MFDVFELLPQIGLSDAVFFSHTYTAPIDQKVERMKRVIRDWDLRTDIKERKPKKRSKSMTSSHQKTPKAAAALAATASQAVTATRHRRRSLRKRSRTVV